MVAFLVLFRVGKIDAAHEFAMKSKNIALKMFKEEPKCYSEKEVKQEASVGDLLIEEGFHQENALTEQAIEALMCSDSDVEANEEDQESQRSKYKPTSANQFNAIGTASARFKFIRESEPKKDQIAKPPKLSKLALLNIVGLIELGTIAVHL